ncbi:MAG: hypothetical protein HDS41_00340 [Bacteroides sp.]|nr:hypothetical protein [Bacteroides sp.]
MSRESNLYVEIWRKKYLTLILCFIKKGEGKRTIDRLDFETAGNRARYGFNLDIRDGKIPLDESNATSRDLRIVLNESEKFRELANGKRIKIKVTDNSKKFELSVDVQPL